MNKKAAHPSAAARSHAFRLPTLTLLRSGSGVCGSPHSQRPLALPRRIQLSVSVYRAGADTRTRTRDDAARPRCDRLVLGGLGLRGLLDRLDVDDLGIRGGDE